MNILFIHQNFPGQFRHIAPALASRGHQVTAMLMKKSYLSSWRRVRILYYGVEKGSTPGIHPWVGDFETKVIRGEACFRRALQLRDSEGYHPDLIVAHPGWGETLFLKEVWPQAKLAIYSEFFYNAAGADIGFDPEFSRVADPGEAARLRMKNLNYRIHFDFADAAVSPTLWQAGTFPEPFRSTITVIHDGIDTDKVVPNPDVRLDLQEKGKTVRLTRRDEIITFVNRNFEPYRGFHIFMRALPDILRKRPRARVLMIGGDGVSYGAGPENGSSWKELFVNEVRPYISDEDWQRVHFPGRVPYDFFLKSFTAILSSCVSDVSFCSLLELA